MTNIGGDDAGNGPISRKARWQAPIRPLCFRHPYCFAIVCILAPRCFFFVPAASSAGTRRRRLSSVL